MNVYIESNFVVEVALDQEQAPACRALMELAEAGSVALVIPAYALLESVEAVTRRVLSWRKVGEDVDAQLQQLRRSPLLQAESDSLRGLATRAANLATTALRTTRTELVGRARILPIDRDTLQDAEGLADRFAMTTADAVMLASVLRDPECGASASLFLNRNRKDFADNDVRTLLQQRNCRVVPSFEAGLAAVRAALRSSD